MKPRKSFFSRSLALSLFAASTVTSPLIRANIIVNGDFSVNASSFTTFPGYIANGSNPQIQGWGYTDLSSGQVGINGAFTGVGAPFAPTSTVGFSNYAFIQNGAYILQGLPTLLPNQEYRISVAAANRSTYPDGSGRIQIGDGTMVFYSSGDQSFSTEAFQTITATFTTPATFNGTPSIQLYGFSDGGDAVVYTNVVLQAVPESLSWDPGVTGTGTAGGSGTWDTSSNFWWDGSSQANWSVSSGQCDAVFAGTPGTVTIDPAGVTASNLNFNTAGYTLTGGSLTLAGSSTLRSPAGTTTIDAPLGGGDPIHLNGASFIIKQPGTQTNVTRLSSNNIGVSVDDAFGSGTIILSNPGIQLFLSALGSTRSFGNAFEWRGNRLIVDNDDMGTGLSAFPLEMGSLLLAGTAPSDFFLRRALTVNGEVSGSGPAGRSLYFVGDANIMALKHPNNTFTGTITWENDTTLEVVADGGMGNPSNTLAFNAGNGMVRLQDSFDSARPISVNGSTVARIDTNGFDSTWSGGITGADGVNSRFRKVGAGTLTLEGSNFLGGGTMVEAGTLVLPAGASLTHSNTWDNFHGIGGGATFQLNGGTMLINLSFYGVGNGLNPTSEAVFQISSGTYTHNGGQVLVGFNGDGRFIMDGGTANINHLAYGDGDPARIAIAELNGGTLSLVQMNRRGGESAATIKLNGTLLTAKTDEGDFMQVGTAGTTEFLVGTGGAKFDTAGFNIAVISDLEHDSSVVGSDGGLTKTGNGTLTLGGANTYTGTTLVSTGTLALVGGSHMSPVDVTAGASLGFTLGSPTTSTSSFDLSEAKITITGTPDSSSHTLITASSEINGTPTLDPAISGYDLMIDGTSLKLVSIEDGFASWMAPFITNGLTGDTTPGGDPDDDGMKNLLEYALDGNPSISDLSILPNLVVTATDFEFTYTRLNQSLMDTVQTFEYGSEFVGWTSVIIPVGPGVDLPVGEAKVTITPTNATTDSVKISIPKSPGGKLFGRLKVVK